MSITKIKIPHKVIIRAPGLLPMLYTLNELASALDIPITLYVVGFLQVLHMKKIKWAFMDKRRIVQSLGG
jgi:uncharacterized membrane protein YcfT